MMSVWTTVCFVLLSIAAVTSIDSGLLEWEKLVDKTVSELRTKRSVPEAEHSIVSLQEHYSDAFQKLNENHRATFQQYGDTQAPVHGRYIVMLDSRVSDEYLDHTVRILENADATSDGRLVARHIKPFRILGKGFTATLGRKMLVLVS